MEDTLNNMTACLVFAKENLKDSSFWFYDLLPLKDFFSKVGMEKVVRIEGRMNATRYREVVCSKVHGT